MTDWGKKRVAELKQALRDRGGKTTGKKRELVERLQGYERNDDFRAPAVVIPAADPMPGFPPLASFHSLTPEDRCFIPSITRSIIEQYVLYRQVHDFQQNWDVNAIKNGEKMAEEGILAVSLFVQDDEEGVRESSIFLTGMVTAEMRNVSIFLISWQRCNKHETLAHIIRMLKKISAIIHLQARD